MLHTRGATERNHRPQGRGITRQSLRASGQGIARQFDHITGAATTEAGIRSLTTRSQQSGVPVEITDTFPRPPEGILPPSYSEVMRHYDDPNSNPPKYESETEL